MPPTSDPECQGKGIPVHLHQLGRPVDGNFQPSELLFRRFAFGKDTLKHILVFNRMSINREKHGHEADDALWNCEQGGRHENCGVAEIPAGAFSQKWQHPTEPNTFYSMRPEHRPLRCNYPHTEVVVYKEGNGTETLQELIKPTSVKLKIREELQKHLKVALPIERQGETFSV